MQLSIPKIKDDSVLNSVESVGKLDSNHLDNVASQDPDTSNDNFHENFRVDFPDPDVSSEGYMNCSKRSKKVVLTCMYRVSQKNVHYQEGRAAN